MKRGCDLLILLLILKWGWKDRSLVSLDSSYSPTARRSAMQCRFFYACRLPLKVGAGGACDLLILLLIFKWGWKDRSLVSLGSSYKLLQAPTALQPGLPCNAGFFYACRLPLKVGAGGACDLLILLLIFKWGWKDRSLVSLDSSYKLLQPYSPTTRPAMQRRVFLCLPITAQNSTDFADTALYGRLLW